MRGAKKRRRQGWKQNKRKAERDPLYKAMCYKKWKHISKADAQKHVEALWRSLGEKFVHAYHCPYCDYYHVGHKQKRIEE